MKKGSESNLLENLRENEREANPEHFYPRLLVNQTRSRFCILVAMVSFAGFFVLIAHELNAGRPWWLLTVPVCGFGLLLTLVPKSEEWEYKPWQLRARRYEAHQLQKM